MVVPLTAWQLVRSFSLFRVKERMVGPSLVLFGFYLVLLILQLICLVFTESRGPLVGFWVGALFFFLILAALRGQRGLALVAVGVSFALIAILAVLNLPNSPLIPPKGIPYIERLARISSSIMHDRSLIWQSAVKLITVDKIRTVIGYGPETMGLIFYRCIHPDWAAQGGYEQIADRSHNETLDTWVTGGLIGLSAYLILFGSIFYYGLKWLGLITNSRQRVLLIVAGLVAGFLGVLIPWLVEGSLRWAGVGIPAGILLAVVVYLISNLFCRGKKEIRGNHDQILLMTLLSALIAHFVEIQFGIAITATRTYFWIYAALLAIIGHYWQRYPEPCPELHRGVVEGEDAAPETAAEAMPPDHSRLRHGRRRRRPGKLQSPKLKAQSSESLAHSLLVGLVLATTGFDFITHQFDLRTNGPVIFGLLLIIWLLGSIPILTPDLQYPISNLSTYALGSLVCFLPFLAAHVAIVLPGAGIERLVTIYYAYLFLVILAVAGALMMGSKSNFKLQTSNLKPQTSNFRFWILSFGVWILSFLLIFSTNLKAAQADIYYKFGLSSEETGDLDKAIACYRRAIQLAPRWDLYHASLGWVYGLKATAASDDNQRAALFEESRKALEHAQQMSPLDPDIVAKLGHVYWNWGGLTTEREQKAKKWEEALAYYQQAVTLSPVNHGYLLQDNIVQTYLHLGAIYAESGRLDRAAEVYQKANEMDPSNYENHEHLALVYLQLGRLDEALEEAKIAVDLVSDEDKAEVENAIVQMRLDYCGVTVWPHILGDLDCDCEVDVEDIQLVTARWRCQSGDDCYEKHFDVDQDGNIDIVDIMLVVARWGEVCP
jgi:tetratricopeptide (TPR) repeat protein/O-antigen ligase